MKRDGIDELDELERRRRQKRPTPTAPWASGLTWTATQGGRVLDKSAGNAELYLLYHSAWSGSLVFDEMGFRAQWAKAPPAVPGVTAPALGPVRDVDWVFAQQWLKRETGRTFPEAALRVAIERAALARKVHAVRAYLDGLVWDRVVRLDRWLVEYLRVRDTPWARAIGAKVLIAGVARVRRPGVKVDTLLILEGEQGTLKSQALRGLMPDESWFDDQLPDLRDKDALLHLRDHWLVEIAELEAFRGANNSRIKSFLSKQSDHYRPPYGRAEIQVPRQCFFIGTTNGAQYLHDTTGARRFWPVRVEQVIALDRIIADRDQLWAEADARFAAEERWWLSADEEWLASEETEARFVADPWEEPVRAILATVSEIRMAELLDRLGCRTEALKGPEASRVAAILRRARWERRRLGTTTRYWAYTPARDVPA